MIIDHAFSQRMHSLLGAEHEAFLEALEASAPTSIRLNPVRNVAPEALSFAHLLEQQVPWCPEGWYLRGRPVFTTDPWLHAGAYYVQEASSMFLSAIIRQLTSDQPVRALDLCAAPGGKSTLLASSLPADSLLVANEVIHSRAQILKENIIKWGADNIVVTSADPARFGKLFGKLSGAFDLLLVDAPCSGEGMFRKDPGAVSEWSENHLRLCEERQKRILADCWDALAPGGYLIYSTCTYNPGENEQLLDWIFSNYAATPVQVETAHHFPGITPGYSHHPCYRFYPHKVMGEGFFIAVLRKEEGETFVLPQKKKNNRKNPEQSQPSAIPSSLFTGKGDYHYYQNEETTGIIPARHAPFIRHLEEYINILYKGCEIGEIIHGKVRYAHSLALLANLNLSAFHTHEADLPTALNYLRKEDIRFDAPQGAWVLITYRSLPLGWVKAAGNRLNNYYPKGWRIKHL